MRVEAFFACNIGVLGVSYGNDSRLSQIYLEIERYLCSL